MHKCSPNAERIPRRLLRQSDCLDGLRGRPSSGRYSPVDVGFQNTCAIGARSASPSRFASAM